MRLGGGFMAFRTGSTFTERLRITSGGNVGIGTTSPSALIHGIKTTEQLRLGYDASNYLSCTVGSGASTTFDLTAGSGTPEFSFSKVVKASGYKSSDGTAGATTDVAVAKVGGGTRTLSFKNGLYTGYTDS
jgi:hypothetical protein